MSDTTNYRAARVPEAKSPEEYTYVERRAEILELIDEAGHPENLVQRRLATRYDVSGAQISKDFDRIREFIRDTLGARRHAISETVFRKAIREKVEAGDMDGAVDAVQAWNEYLREEGVRDVEPEQRKTEISGAVWEDLTGYYEEDE